VVELVPSRGDEPTEVARWTLLAHLTDGCALVAVDGEVCASSAPELERTLVRVVDEEGPSLVLDLSAVQTISAAGITALLRLRRHCHDRAGSFVVRDPSDAVVDLLDRVALFDLLVERRAPLAPPVTSTPPSTGTSRRRAEMDRRHRRVERDDLFVQAPATMDGSEPFARLLDEIADDCNLHLDVSQVARCTDDGLRLLVDVADRVEGVGGSVRLRGPSEVLLGALRDAGLDGVFPVATVGRSRPRSAADRRVPVPPQPG
jgi:anti-anti-sigma factor